MRPRDALFGLATGGLVAWVRARDLDVLTLGEEAAWYGGVEVRRACDSDAELGYSLMKRFAAVIIERMQTARLQMLDLYDRRA